MSEKYERHYLYRIYPAWCPMRGNAEQPFYAVAISEEQATLAVRTRIADQANSERAMIDRERNRMNPGREFPVMQPVLPSQIDILRSERIEGSPRLVIVEDLP